MGSEMCIRDRAPLARAQCEFLPSPIQLKNRKHRFVVNLNSTVFFLTMCFPFQCYPRFTRQCGPKNIEKLMVFACFSILCDFGHKLRPRCAKIGQDRPEMSQERRKMNQDRLQDGPRWHPSCPHLRPSLAHLGHLDLILEAIMTHLVPLLAHLTVSYTHLTLPTKRIV